MSIRARFQLQKNNLDLSVDIDIPSTGITAITGASGSGKTTLLRLLAGLESSDSGSMCIDGFDWQDKKDFVPTHKRDISYVFQEDNLLPHLSVRDNLKYAHARSHTATSHPDLINILDIDNLMDSMPHELSGGERQRVAIARALGGSPRLILMDEPLSSLDQKRKNIILPFLERIHQKISTPIIYVSHSKEEILRLSDYIVEMDDGKVINQGASRDIINDIESINTQVMDFMSILPVKIISHNVKYGVTYAEFSNTQITIPHIVLEINSTHQIKISANDVSISLSRPSDTSIVNIFEGTIVDIKSSEFKTNVYVNVSGFTIVSLISLKSYEDLKLNIGKKIFIQIKCMSLI